MLVKFGPGMISRGRSTAVVVARQCGRRIVSPHHLPHPFSISAASFSDGCGSSSGSSSSSGGKAKLKIKKQEGLGHAGAASGVTGFGDDESDDDDKKKSRQGGKRHRKKEGRDDDDEDDFAHKLSDDESHTQREEMNKAAQEKAMFVTKAGAVANVSLALSKGAVGFAISSTGLIADAANSLGDVLCDGVVYYAIQEARKTATPDRPWGRGKVESLGKVPTLSRIYSKCDVTNTCMRRRIIGWSTFVDNRRRHWLFSYSRRC